MSAPDTNVERQAKRHRAPIWGILIALVFGIFVGALLSTGTAFFRGQDPDGANVQIDGRTGEVEQN